MGPRGGVVGELAPAGRASPTLTRAAYLALQAAA